MLDKLAEINIRFEEVGEKLTLPDVVSDQKKFAELSKQYKDLEPIVKVYKEYKLVLENIASSKEILNDEDDPEMKEMAKLEIDELTNRKLEMDEEIKILLIPKDPADDKNCIVELRAGTGGDEACIFVEDMYRLYTMYFKTIGFKCEVVNSTEGTVKGYKEISLEVSGESAYGVMKFESGVHRVQRVPETESQGRVHTSAITIAVMPEAEEVDFQLNMKDVRKDTFRASGAGGQHVNKTESAVRLTHEPTGTVVECQDGRSQHQNYDKALQVLRSRLYQALLDEQNSEISATRKALVGSGDRSAKIRTYNYPQGRVTDHRINKTIYNLSNYMNGDVQEMFDAMKMAETAEKMKEGESF
ncbi:MAG: peptide chain release factor 1 [Flavobacteriales bacterium]|nr:peptide chain release factor 1 [Flavobacteriales bacterium]|tara:strand:+ start:6624 stop:7697 length:1074 start_codon:yes stop_codon:yes gene_type:complete